MSETAPLEARIRDRFVALPAKQQSVARLLADDPEAVAITSVSDLARRAGVDAATVVRTCQNLGYTGWRELLAEVRLNVTRHRTFAERVARLGSQDENLTRLIRENARRNVEETFEGLNHDAFERSAGVLSAAGTVLVAASGVSAGVGEFLTSSLRVIGVRATLVTDVSDAAPALGALDSGDAVVGISVWRYLRSTIETLRYAATAGARTVALTDSAVSPAARASDHALTARTVTVGPRLSMTGMTALAEALVARVASLDPARARRAAAIADQFYFDGHVLGEQEPDRPDTAQPQPDGPPPGGENQP